MSQYLAQHYQHKIRFSSQFIYFNDKISPQTKASMMDDWTQNHFYILLPYPAKAPNKPSLIHMEQTLVSIKRF